MSESKNVWVLIEHEEGQIETASLETLSCGRQLADSLGGSVVAVVAGSEDQELTEELASYGADDILFLGNSRQFKYSADFYTEFLSRIIKEKSPNIFLCGATLTSRELAPRIAAKLGTGLISECMSLSINPEGRLTGDKLTHGGRISSTILCPASGTQVATVKPGIITISRQNKTKQAKIRVITPEPGQVESRIRVKSVVKAAPDKISLDEAEVIVAGGKGVGSLENVQLLEEFAGCLGGVVAGSLGAVDEGWLPRKKLVGQTGTTVAPKLYIACGISGSIYHVLGMKDSGFIIAINKDHNAPIFKVADMSIIGDVTEIISTIVEKLPGTAEKTGNSAEAGNA